MKQPKCIEMNLDDESDFIKRLKNSDLSANDQGIVTGLIEFNKWLEFSLKEKSISISKLQKIYKVKPEKRSKCKKNKDKQESEPVDNNDKSDNLDPTNNEPEPDTETDVDAEESNVEDKSSTNSKNSGRLSHEEYPGAEIVPLILPYRPGDLCPEGCGGRLKFSSSGHVIKITGQRFAKAIKYETEKLRCNLCEKYFTASLPADVSPNKYDTTFKAHLCVYKHFLGVPNYRLEHYQKFVGVPLPDSTQWDKTEEVANACHPVFKYLENYAANSILIHGDDTRVKILSLMQVNTEDDKTRKGMFTTGILAYNDGHKIHLFYIDKKHTGETIKELLDKRESSQPKALYMCDALSSNMPKDLKAIVINCLVHSRRNFIDIESYFPKECSYVLDIFSLIYKFEKEAKGSKLNQNERLAYHKKYSRPQIKKLYSWINKQFSENQIEENSSLGKACKYMLKHADRLTRFLRIPGAPLDNNEVEKALKMAIRVRKNSLFYATEHGAYIGSMLQSLIYTAISAGQNPVEYLTALQDYKAKVRLEPSLWLPWNYLNTINQLVGLEAA